MQRKAFWALLGGAALAGLVVTPAVAADAAAPPATSATGAPPPGDIVVTAQRRSENLRDVPIAISVVTGDALKKQSFTQLSDIQYLAPSVQYVPTPAAPVFQIRGIGTQSFDFAIEQSVGVSLDDVVQTLPRVNPLNLLADVDHVEVLRGPQGTLLGKNTSAGLISITTKRPQIGVYSNEGHLQYGENRELQVYDIVNVPLGQTLALRLRGGYQLSDNVYRNVGPGSIADNRDYNFNGKLLWEPTDRLSIYVIGDYQNGHGDPGEWSIRKFGSGAVLLPGLKVPIVGPTLGALGIQPGPDNRTVALDGDNFQSTKSYGGQLTANYDLGGPTLTSVTAYRKLKFDNMLEADAVPLTVLDHNSGAIQAHEFTQEVRLSSPNSATIEYTVGLYYYDQKTKSQSDQSGGLGFLPNNYPIRLSTVGGQSNFAVENESYAAFGQATWHATRKLRLTLGGRYTHDSVHSSVFTSALPGVCNATAFLAFGVCQLAPLPSSPVGGSRKHGDWTGRAAVQYDIADRTMAYASVSRGYKGAAITTVSGGEVFNIDPETVVSVEAGVKSSLFDRKLDVNLALFHSKFNDFQTQQFDPTLDDGLGAFRPGNAGGLRTQGVELEFSARPLHGLALNGGLTYTSAKFTSYVDAPCPVTFNCPANNPTFDASGDRLPNAPRWSYTVGGSYDTRISDGLKGFVTANYAYRSAVLFGVADEGTRQKGYGLTNLNVGVGDPNDHVRVSVYVRNLFDRHFAGAIFPSFFDQGGYSQVLPDAAFRRIGGAIDWRF